MTHAAQRTIDGIDLLDYHPSETSMLDDVLEGLSDPHQKRVPSQYLYDARGSRLFDDITELPEYYLTRTEMQLFASNSASIAAFAGPLASVIELGSGSEMKIERLMGMLERPSAYIPVEISRTHLVAASAALQDRHPEFEVLPVCADFTNPFDVPEPEADHEGRLVFFPGSTIGNFDPERAKDVLRTIRGLLRQGDERDGVLIGVDLMKPLDVLMPAYDDEAGVTADFTLNVLDRLNRELEADFDRDAFAFEARFREGPDRVEMHAVAKEPTSVRIDDRTFQFARGESIHTESSHKFTTEGFSELAESCGMRVVERWIDTDHPFAEFGLRRI
ncbi:MAG: L-histidine N(alpha)-methyltransferase [Planctomycetota bacterium]